MSLQEFLHQYSCRIARAAAAPVLVGLLMCPAPAEAQMAGMAMSGLPNNVPDFCASANISSARNGAWSDPATWSPARVPTANDLVRVSAGTSVTYDVQSSAALNCVGVHGQLAFRTDVNTRLTVGTLLIYPDGGITVGTSAAPVASTVLAEIVIADWALNTSTDPETFGTGFIGFGKVTMRGAVRTPTFVRLTVEPTAGQTTLRLASAPSGWRAGDRLILPDTRTLAGSETSLYGNYVPQYDDVRVASISGTTVTLQSALQFNHAGARNDQGVLEFLPHVSNMTRNIVVRSANPSGTRGHVLFGHLADVDVEYVNFADLGRTTINGEPNSTTFDANMNVTALGSNQIGRYALHLHHLRGPAGGQANGYQYTLIGNAIEGGSKWAIGIHNSHYGLIDGNVMYRNAGAALMTEDCSESFNVIQNNIAIRSSGSGDRASNTGVGPVGFFFRGPNNYVRNNVATGFQPGGPDSNPDTGYGYKYFQQFCATDGNPASTRVPKFPGADTMDDSQVNLVDVTTLPILQFDNNEVYGATESGLSYWWVGAYFIYPRPNVPVSTFKGLKVWHVSNRAVFAYESSNVVIDGLVIRDSNQGFYAADYLTDNLVIQNADLSGVNEAIAPSTFSGPRPQTIQNSRISANVGIILVTPWTSGVMAERITPRSTIISNVTFATQTAISMSYATTPQRNIVTADTVRVFNYNGVAGDNFSVYYKEQAPAFVVPQTVGNGIAPPASEAGSSVLGAPVAGLTNALTWATYGIAIAGAVAPCATTRAGINGFVCALSPGPPAPGPSLSVTLTGSGTVVSTPAAISCAVGTCSSTFASGSTVQLSAVPASGATFLGWGGACSGTGSCSVAMNGAQSVTATFSQVGSTGGSTTGPTQYSLSATVSGSGTVTSNPSGLSCSGGTCSANFPQGITVQLVATPAGGATFTGWSGACSGAGACNVTMTAAQSVSAAFTQSGHNGQLQPPPAPTGLRAGKSGQNIRLAWTAASGGTSYVIKRGLSPSGEFPLTTGVTSTSFIDAQVSAGVTYYYRVAAANSAGQSADSNEVLIKIRPGKGSTAARTVAGDFDGDGMADLTVYRETTGHWFALQSGNGYSYSNFADYPWGLPGDKPLPGDFDGDGKTDLAIYRPSTGGWYIRYSSDNYSMSSWQSFQWGLPGDVPVLADFDGDGRSDLVVYRPTTGEWLIRFSSSQYSYAAWTSYQWGLPGDVPAAGDFDGDGQADLAVYRPSTGDWFVRFSSDDYSYSTWRAYQWGLPNDVPLAADFDGDGRVDLVVYRPSTGMWFVRFSSTGYSYTGWMSYQWGLPGDVPMPNDFDGDGRTDLAVWRPSTGQWMIRYSSLGYSYNFMMRGWGLTTDVPLGKK